ncbi:MAG: acylhydrolase [Alistipes sp.]|jgi:lysophospholipase L1-like esterase|nr:acylhydrolase [Alistipes sp.]
MKRVLLTALMCIVAVSSFAQDKKKDWAQFGRYEKSNTEVLARDVRPDVVFMGNSITDGWARQDPKFFEENNFVGRGIGGQTSSEMLVRFRRDVIDLNPKCVVILSGTNDIAQNNGYIKPENTLGNIISMCELAKANGIKVILCSITPTSVFGWRREVNPVPLIAELNKMIEAYAKENGIYYLNYHPALTDEKGGIPAKWSNDTCHPNLECYRTVMEPMVCEAIDKVLKTPKKKAHKAIPFTK